LEDVLRPFHTLKDVFLYGQAGKKAKANATGLKLELVNKRKVEKKTNAQTWMPSKKRRKITSWRDYISHAIDVSKEFDADFNLLRIHMRSHWVEQICPFGTLQ
jgi:hypothetical protein